MFTSDCTLPYLEFVGGDTVEYGFNLYSKNNLPYETADDFIINFSVINFSNQDYCGAALQYTSTDSNPCVSVISGDEGYINRVMVKIPPMDTCELCGKYVYQITIIDSSGMPEVAGKGIMRINRNTNPDFIKSIKEA